MADKGVSNVVGTILIVGLVVALVVLVTFTVFNISDDETSSPEALNTELDPGVSDHSNVRILEDPDSEYVVVRSPLGTEYNVTDDVGATEDILKVDNSEKISVLVGSDRSSLNLVKKYEFKDGIDGDIIVDKLKRGERFEDWDYEKIQHGVDNATVGDNIIVRRAEYDENVDVDKNVSIIAEPDTAIKDLNPERAVFDITGDNATVRNFNVDADPRAGDGHYSENGIYIAGNNVEARNNKILNASKISNSAGINVTGKSARIIGNTLNKSYNGITSIKHSDTHVVRRNNMLDLSRFDVKNLDSKGLNARRNYWDNKEDVYGVVDTTNELGDRVSDRIPGQGNSNLVGGNGRVVFNNDRLFILNGKGATDLYKLNITLSFDSGTVTISPTASNKFEVVETTGDIDSDKVFNNTNLIQHDTNVKSSSSSTEDSGGSAGDTSTLRSGEAISFTVNTSYVDPVSSGGTSGSGSGSGGDGSSSDGSNDGSSSGDSTTDNSAGIQTVSVSSTDSSGGSSGGDGSGSTGGSNDLTSSSSGESGLSIDSFNIKDTTSSTSADNDTNDGSSGDESSTDGSTDESSTDSSSSDTDSILQSVNTENTNRVKFELSIPDQERTVPVNTEIKFETPVIGLSESQVRSYDWRMGDGTVKSGQTVNHTYDQVGKYRALVTVTATDGKKVSSSVNVNVTEPDTTDNYAPTARATVSEREVFTSETVTFSASGSKDYDGRIASIEWVAGQKRLSGETVTTQFSTGGKKEVTAEVTDDDGATTEISTEITVYDGSVRIDGATNPKTVVINEYTAETPSSFSPVEYIWSYDNKTKSTTDNKISITFSEAQSTELSVKAVGSDFNRTDSISLSVTDSNIRTLGSGEFDTIKDGETVQLDPDEYYDYDVDIRADDVTILGNGTKEIGEYNLFGCGVVIRDVSTARIRHESNCTVTVQDSNLNGFEFRTDEGSANIQNTETHGVDGYTESSNNTLSISNVVFDSTTIGEDISREDVDISGDIEVIDMRSSYDYDYISYQSYMRLISYATMEYGPNQKITVESHKVYSENPEEPTISFESSIPDKDTVNIYADDVSVKHPEDDYLSRRGYNLAGENITIGNIDTYFLRASGNNNTIDSYEFSYGYITGNNNTLTDFSTESLNVRGNNTKIRNANFADYNTPLSFYSNDHKLYGAELVDITVQNTDLYYGDDEALDFGSLQSAKIHNLQVPSGEIAGSTELELSGDIRVDDKSSRSEITTQGVKSLPSDTTVTMGENKLTSDNLTIYNTGELGKIRYGGSNYTVRTEQNATIDQNITLRDQNLFVEESSEISELLTVESSENTTIKGGGSLEEIKVNSGNLTVRNITGERLYTDYTWTGTPPYELIIEDSTLNSSTAPIIISKDYNYEPSTDFTVEVLIDNSSIISTDNYGLYLRGNSWTPYNSDQTYNYSTNAQVKDSYIQSVDRSAIRCYQDSTVDVQNTVLESINSTTDYEGC